jgi:hypothetical protein
MTTVFSHSGILTRHIVCISLLAIVLTGCASRRFARLALKSEQAGLYEDAAEYYLKSVQANRNNIESKIGAKKTGQISLDRKLSEFSAAYASGQNKNAVYFYLNAKKYQEKFQYGGIELDMPPSYEEQYNESKKIHVEEKYKVGVKLLQEEKFNESEPIFKEIMQLENNYKDVKDLFKTAHYEPIYRQAKNDYENKTYRKAYYQFNTIVNEITDYKEAVQYRQDALNSATFTIWVRDFESAGDPLLASRMKNSIISRIKNSGNPFIKIVDNVNVPNPLNDPSLNLSGGKFRHIANERIPSSVKAILTGKVMNSRISRGTLQNNTAKGYLKQTRQTTNSAGQTVNVVDYKKIEYYIYNQSADASCILKYQLTATETGEVLVTDEIETRESDAIRYASYDGDHKNVVPGFWKWKNLDSKEDNVKSNQAEVRNLQDLFTSRRQLKSTDELISEMLESSSMRAGQKIVDYNPEK